MFGFSNGKMLKFYGINIFGFGNDNVKFFKGDGISIGFIILYFKF